MNIKLNYYKKIIKLKKKFNFNDFDLITNYGLFSGDTNLFKTLTIYSLLMKTKLVKGEIIELGIHKGNTSLLIKKILDLFKINKKLYLLDHYKGLLHYERKDTKWSLTQRGKYVGKKKQIAAFIKYFKFKNIKFIDKDATTLTKEYFNDKLKFSLAYFDMDLYLPTLKGLLAIDKNISLGGYIVFDEEAKKKWSERLAIEEFLKYNKKYKKIIIDHKRQPDVILKKIRN